MPQFEKPTEVSLDKPASSPEKSKKFTSIALPTAFMLLLVLVIFGVVFNNKKSEKDVDYGDKAGAQAACEQAIRSKLDKPDTANFNNPQTQQNTRVPSEYQAIGSVESESPDGILAVKSYKCDLTYIAETKDWSIKTNMDKS